MFTAILESAPPAAKRLQKLDDSSAAAARPQKHGLRKALENSKENAKLSEFKISLKIRRSTEE